MGTGVETAGRMQPGTVVRLYDGRLGVVGEYIADGRSLELWLHTGEPVAVDRYEVYKIELDPITVARMYLASLYAEAQYPYSLLDKGPEQDTLGETGLKQEDKVDEAS